jgi:hypothetical protein
VNLCTSKLNSRTDTEDDMGFAPSGPAAGWERACAPEV